MVEFKTKNGMASLESQIVVTPQMAKLLKSNDKRVKAFIKDAKLTLPKVEHILVENKSILDMPIANGDSMKTISHLEKVHKELLGLFEEEEQKAIAEEEGKKAADEEFGLETIKAFAHAIIEKAKNKNIGVTVISHDGTSGEYRVHGTIPEELAVAILLKAIDEEG